MKHPVHFSNLVKCFSDVKYFLAENFTNLATIHYSQVFTTKIIINV